MSENIHVVYHIAFLGHWKDIVKEQLELLRDSGLGEACQSLTISATGARFVNDRRALESLLADFPFTQKATRRYASNLGAYEFPTLKEVQKIAQEMPAAKILYFHTKGVSHKRVFWPEGVKNMNQWRKIMEYFTIEQWRDCVAILEDYDICGVDWGVRQRDKPAHFSGNFWWATGEYLNRCQLNPGPRQEAEYFIGTGSPKVCNLFKPWDNDQIRQALSEEELTALTLFEGDWETPIFDYAAYFYDRSFFAKSTASQEDLTPTFETPGLEADKDPEPQTANPKSGVALEEQEPVLNFADLGPAPEPAGLDPADFETEASSRKRVPEPKKSRSMHPAARFHSPPAAQPGVKVGVGVVTMGRRDLKDYRLAPDTEFYVHIDEAKEGPGHGRNVCLRHLVDQGCDHIFLFDDDCYPMMAGWEDFFISKALDGGIDFMTLPEYFKDEVIDYPNAPIDYWNRGTMGCFIYQNRTALEKIGGYNEAYDRYGFEDSARNYRALKAGLCGSHMGYPFPLRGMPYIFSEDVYGLNPIPNLTHEEKQAYIQKNEPIYWQEIEKANQGICFYPF